MSTFDEVPERLNFPKMEEDILAFWKEVDAFKESVRQSEEEGRPEYTFYDGPPFATGTPHYGHILAGTIKDTVTRYAHQTGHHVVRRFGWDTHGLPVEFEVDKMLGVQSSADVEKMGIAAYNAKCRSIVTRYCGEWEEVVSRLGRWIDFENDYKTMEPWFMESVWWVFKTIYDKGLVYKGFRVMPYSTACTTPLSNFESKLNYKEATDLAVVVRFPLVDTPEVAFVAWTTTPWTLPSNLALCVNPSMTYLQVKDVESGAHYIMAQVRLSEVYPAVAKEKLDTKTCVMGFKHKLFEVEKVFKGSELAGLRYTPPFSYFKSHPNAHVVLQDDYVTEDGGTGVVHQAPAFGEDDFRVCMAAGVIVKGGAVPCPVDADGCFEDVVTDFAGLHVKAKETNEKVCVWLKEHDVLVKKGSVRHSVGFCWRSETPLINKVVPSWFVAVESFKEDLLKNNAQTYWVPSAVKEKRFHNWLADARDWNISRNRYWGTPLPIWMSEDGEEVVVVGSIQELADLSGETVTDLHRESIDHIIIPSKQGKGDLRRVPEVFDCWFESGSMPYAQQHYPFENQARFENGFPANFIAEGLDQTRGWFYTLMVLSTALFNKPAFQNLIVNGLVLAEDGKKMSKSKKNYDDPLLVVNLHGADSLRLYLINSPVVRAEPFRFKTMGVQGVLKDVFLPWFNAFRFFVQNAQRQMKDATDATAGQVFTREDAEARSSASTNVMDKWVLAALHHLIKFVREEMAAYRLYTVVPALLHFLEQLTNWYVRLNRGRFRAETDSNEKNDASDTTTALSTLYVVLLNMSKLMAPFTPFFAEYTYQMLARPSADPADRKIRSVHFCSIPEFNPTLLNDEIEAKMAALESCINLGRLCRERVNISLKTPVSKVVVVHRDQTVLDGINELRGYIESELNTRELVLTTKEEEWCSLSAEPDNKALGMRLGKGLKDVKAALPKLTTAELEEFERSGKLVLAGHEITTAEVHVNRAFKGDTKVWEAATSADGGLLLCVDKREDESLILEGLARQVLNRIQKLRKAESLSIHDSLHFFYEVSATPPSDPIAAAAAAHSDSGKGKSGNAKTGKANAATGKFMASKIQKAIEECSALIGDKLKAPLLPVSKCPVHAIVAGDATDELSGAGLRVVLVRKSIFFPASDVLQGLLSSVAPVAADAAATASQTAEVSVQDLVNAVSSMNQSIVLEKEANNEPLEIRFATLQEPVKLVPGVHFSSRPDAF